MSIIICYFLMTLVIGLSFMVAVLSYFLSNKCYNGECNDRLECFIDAEKLILRLDKSIYGRDLWLRRYGRGIEAEALRRAYEI